MQRTESCLRELHERIVLLEERPALQAPTDEQLERVLRKILAERFSLPDSRPAENARPVNSDNALVGGRTFMECPRPIMIDPASLVVEPDSVPSKAYAETFQKLESRLQGYPRMSDTARKEDTRDVKLDMSVKIPHSPDSV